MSDVALEEVKELLETLGKVFRESNLTQLEYRQGHFDIYLAKDAKPSVDSSVNYPPPPSQIREKPEEGPSEIPVQFSEKNSVKAPLVGTVYLSPEPGKPSFVSTGDQVQEGQTLLIIEAMKVMNYIRSPRAGCIKKILVSDGAPVEYGTPLVLFET